MEYGCDCSCDYDDGEHPAVHTEQVVRARKTHVCCECGEEIKVGEQYERAKGLWDGSWGTYTTCIPCMRIRDDLCSCFIYGHLRETVWDCLGIDLVTGETRD